MSTGPGGDSRERGFHGLSVGCGKCLPQPGLARRMVSEQALARKEACFEIPTERNRKLQALR